MNDVDIRRFDTNPIVTPELDESLGTNINGPSLIRVPDWVENPLGEYYLFFASHSGEYIRLAYADDLSGPWEVHRPGALHIDETQFPSTTVGGVVEKRSTVLHLAKPFHGVGKRIIDALSGFSDVSPALQSGVPHIASPDVHVDRDAERLRMYYHGSCGRYVEDDVELDQFTRGAVSSDGLSFGSRPEKLGRYYFRVFEYGGRYYALARHDSPGDQSRSGIAVYESSNPLSGFERRTTLLNDGARHAAIRVHDSTLQIFYSRIGDRPEGIRYTTVTLDTPTSDWVAEDPSIVLGPSEEYEGTDRPLEPSEFGAASERVQQIRDPALFEGEDGLFLLYTVAGERGIAIAEITDERILQPQG